MENDRYVHSMDWGKDINEADVLKNYRQYQYDLIKDYIGKKIIEVGSGARGFIKQILDNNENIERLYSLEPSETLFNQGSRNYQFPGFVEFVCADLFDLDKEKTGRFDTAIFIHVLEHIKEDKKALDTISDFVNPGGYVLIEVPAIQALFSVHDEILGHFRRYNKKMLRSIVDTDKYEIVKLWYQDPVGILGSLYFFKLRKTKLKSDKGVNMVKNQGGIYDKYVIPFEKQLEKFITFPFGLSLTAILKRR
jgi:SAM-dependent methyltransferase